MPEQSVPMVSMGGGGGVICGTVLLVFAGVTLGRVDPMGLVEMDCGRLAERMGWVPSPPHWWHQWSLCYGSLVWQPPGEGRLLVHLWYVWWGWIDEHLVDATDLSLGAADLL